MKEIEVNIAKDTIKSSMQALLDLIQEQGEVNEILTNSAMASLLQDSDGYVHQKFDGKITPLEGIYPVGQLGDITMYVDPYQKWTDCSIKVFVGEKLRSTINVMDYETVVGLPYNDKIKKLR